MQAAPHAPVRALRGRALLQAVLGSLSFALLVGIAGCGSSPSLEADGGSDAGPQVDARDFCDPVAFEQDDSDPCVFVIPDAFQPARLIVVIGGDDTAYDRHPDSTYCEGADGFYVDDQTAPTIATLCPATCAALTGIEGADVSGTACGI